MALFLAWSLVSAPLACAEDGNSQPPAGGVSTDHSQDETGGWAGALWNDLRADLVYTGRNAYLDVKGIVLFPLSLPRFLRKITWKEVAVGVLAAGAITGTVFLDEQIREVMRDIPDDTARSIQTASEATLWVGAGCLYVGGLIRRDPFWRQTAITTFEAYPVSFFIARGVKAAAGRLRPYEAEDPYQWLEGGESFVSDAASPAFALAAGVSHGLGDKWWSILPAYGAALGVGVGRMGQDKHWGSDILGSAAVGICTAKAFLLVHESRDRQDKGGEIPPAAQASLGPVAGLAGGRGFGLHLCF